MRGRSLAALALAAALGTVFPGCWAPFVYDECWKPAWRWACDRIDLVVREPGTGAVGEFVVTSEEPASASCHDRAFRLANESERRLTLDEAREESCLLAGDAVIGCWGLDPACRLGPYTRLVVVRAFDGAPVVHLRGTSAWQRCDVIELRQHVPPVRKVAVTVGVVPLLVLAAALDGSFVGLIAVACVVWFLNGFTVSF